MKVADVMKKIEEAVAKAFLRPRDRLLVEPVVLVLWAPWGKELDIVLYISDGDLD